MKQREFGWHVILYNINRIIKTSNGKEVQTFFILIILIYVFPDRAQNYNINKKIYWRLRNLTRFL